jgi:hypothetical protein
LWGEAFDLWNLQQLKDAAKSGVFEHCSNVVACTAKKVVEIIDRNMER